MSLEVAQTEAALALPGEAWRVVRKAVVQSGQRHPVQLKKPWHRRPVLAMVVFFALVLGLQYVLFQCIQRDVVPIRDPIYSEKTGLLKKHRSYFTSDANRARCLVLGSSRTQLVFDGSSLTSPEIEFFNYGCAGCGPIANALYMHRLYQTGLRCDLVMIELHAGMLAELPEPFEARWLQPHRLSESEVQRLRGYGWAIPTPEQHKPFAWLKTLHTYRYNLLDSFAPALLPCPFGMGLLLRSDNRGHVPGIVVPAQDELKYLAQARVEYNDAFQASSIGGAALHAIYDMIHTVKQHGGKPLLIVMPESDEFRNWYHPQLQQVVSEQFCALAEHHQVPLIDASTWLSREDFADGHHAVPLGTAKFTQRFQQELPNLARQLQP